MAKIGFIGMGNMGGAMLKGLSKIVDTADLMFADANTENAKKVFHETGVMFADSNAELASKCKYIVLAVKPVIYPKVLKNIQDIVKPGNVVISIAPGISIEQLKLRLGADIRIVRAMPNTPALVGEGMTGIAYDEKDFSEEEIADIEMIFSSLGRFMKVDEHLIPVVTAASGSSPAYVYMFIEAMADSVVRYGMPRNQAYEFVAQTVLGSAKMVLETGEHPGRLKDNVCSPGGTTIAGVAALEQNGFRSSIFAATEACYNKAK
ncbi:MAG: pyrroline-5-carboxylate reductase [Lachnospiraceae bacterium]|nr:pyrroline-5-carboxylate reductase [Lachnospiraceae bacterium]